MRPMHIVDSTLFFAPHSGGVKRYLWAKHRYLESVPGMRHTLLVPGPRGAPQMPGMLQISAPRIPFAGGYRIPLRPAQWSKALCRLEPDVIEVGDPYHLAWPALGAAERLGVPAVAFAHSHLSRLFANRLGTWAGNAADAYLRRLYARFDVVFAPSHMVGAHLQSIGVANVEIQPLGVDGTIFHPCAHDPDMRALLGLAANTRLLIYAGRMGREKSIPLMCRAVEALGAPYHLLLVGAAQRRRLSPRITELPYQQNARQLARLLASADALLHAGQQETFGLVILEAMACARPVIAVDSGAVAELIDAQVGCLAEQGRVESLQHAIETLFGCDRAHMGARARERIEHSYTWERVLGAQLLRYRQLAFGQGSHAPLVANPACP
jgi:alpha-1,6-mannosyltransferase